MDGHKFPESWELVSAWAGRAGETEALISGPEFPELEAGCAYPEFKVIVRTEEIEYSDDNPAPKYYKTYRHEIRKL